MNDPGSRTVTTTEPPPGDGRPSRKRPLTAELHLQSREKRGKTDADFEAPPRTIELTREKLDEEYAKHPGWAIFHSFGKLSLTEWEHMSDVDRNLEFKRLEPRVRKAMAEDTNEGKIAKELFIMFKYNYQRRKAYQVVNGRGMPPNEDLATPELFEDARRRGVPEELWDPQTSQSVRDQNIATRTVKAAQHKVSQVTKEDMWKAMKFGAASVSTLGVFHLLSPYLFGQSMTEFLGFVRAGEWARGTTASGLEGLGNVFRAAGSVVPSLHDWMPDFEQVGKNVARSLGESSSQWMEHPSSSGSSGIGQVAAAAASSIPFWESAPAAALETTPAPPIFEAPLFNQITPRFDLPYSATAATMTEIEHSFYVNAMMSLLEMVGVTGVPAHAIKIAVNLFLARRRAPMTMGDELFAAMDATNY